MSGENFIPPGLANVVNTGSPPFNSSSASFDNWLRGFLPSFSDRNVERVKDLYPETGSSEEIPNYNTSYTRAGLIYRDSVLACPTYWTARSAHKKSYVGEYSIAPAKHASDTEWVVLSFSLALTCSETDIWQWNKVNAIQKSQPLIYSGFTGAFASFFQTGDPNAHKLTTASEPGVYENWGTGEEFVIESSGFENVRVDTLNKRCGFWRQVAADVPI